MTTTKNLGHYEHWWKDEVYAEPDTLFKIVFATKREAEAARLKAYGFKRALREWMTNPEIPWVAKQTWAEVNTNMELKECVIKKEGSEWALMIRPRLVMQPVRVTREAVSVENATPAVQAQVQSKIDLEEAQRVYEERVKREREQPARDPLQEFLNNMGGFDKERGNDN